LDFFSSAVAQETLRYVIVSNGKTQGSEVDTFGSDGRIDSSFEFTIAAGAKDIGALRDRRERHPSRTDITGNDYLKGQWMSILPSRREMLIGKARLKTDD